MSFTKVIVAGSINMGLAVSQSTPETMLTWLSSGRSANQALAAARFGAPTALLGLLDEKYSNAQIKQCLKSTEVDMAGIHLAQKNGSWLLSNHRAIEAVSIEKDVLIAQLDIQLDTLKYFFLVGLTEESLTILNAAPLKSCPKNIWSMADIVILNSKSLAFYSSIGEQYLDNEKAVAEAARNIQAFSSQTIIIHPVLQGVFALFNGRQLYIESHPQQWRYPSGAEDCFIGVLAAALRKGDSFPEALKYAAIAADLCGQQAGVGMPDREQIYRWMTRKEA